MWTVKGKLNLAGGLGPIKARVARNLKDKEDEEDNTLEADRRVDGDEKVVYSSTVGFIYFYFSCSTLYVMPLP